MAITKALADAYFGDKTHSDAPIWAQYDNNAREAAVAEAKRWLESQRMTPRYTGTGSSPTSQSTALDTDATTDADFPREDVAVYEQALWFLMFGNGTHDGTLTGPKWISARIKDMREAGASKFQLAPLARHWMGWDAGGVQIMRG